MNEDNVDVQAERKSLLLELQRKVDYAFEKRIKVKFIPETQSIQTDTERAEGEYLAIKKLLEMGVSPEDIEVSLGGEPIPSNQVIVNNPHDYKDLMMMAINKVWKPGRLTQNQKNEIVAKNLEHEFGHHVPALGLDGVSVKYAVSFFEDKDTGLLLFGPSTVIEGKMNLTVYQKIVSGSTEQSDTDRIMQGID